MYARASELATIPNQGHFFNGDKPTYRLTPAGPDHAEVAAAAGIVDYYRAVHAHHVGPVDEVTDVDVVRSAYALFAAHEQSLMEPLVGLLSGRDGVRLVGAETADHSRRAPTFAFHSARRSSVDIYQDLVGAGISCGYGNFYAYRLMQALGLDPDDGVVRLSLVHYNSRAEVDRALEVLDKAL